MLMPREVWVYGESLNPAQVLTEKQRIYFTKYRGMEVQSIWANDLGHLTS
jgi:hypothetical protein